MPESTKQQTPLIAYYGFRGGDGGLSHVMLNLMNATVEQGVNVHILLHSTNIPELARLNPQIKKVELGEAKGLSRVLAVSKYLQQEQPDAILTNREPANRIATLARWISKSSVKIVIRVGMAISTALERRSWLKRVLRKWGMVVCYRRADVIIANAEGVAKDIRDVTGLPLERISVLENPTVIPDMLLQAQEPVEHPWLASGMPPVVIGVGRLARQKDFPTLLKAFKLLRSEMDCRLLILGEGKERDALETLAEEAGMSKDVDFFGFVANPFQYMSRAALFVLSSAWEGSPNVLIQALALGVPSVSTDCPGGAREILADGKYGALVPVGDYVALFEAMKRTLSNPLPAAELQKAAERFRADRCAQAYLAAMGLG